MNTTTFTWEDFTWLTAAERQVVTEWAKGHETIGLATDLFIDDEGMVTGGTMRSRKNRLDRKNFTLGKKTKAPEPILRWLRSRTKGES